MTDETEYLVRKQARFGSGCRNYNPCSWISNWILTRNKHCPWSAHGEVSTVFSVKSDDLLVTSHILVLSHMTPYSLYRLVHYFWQWPIGLWSKVAHYIGNRVPVGMHPQSVWGWRVGRMKEETQGMMGMLPWATRLEDPERTDGERKTGGWWHRDGGMTDWRESEVWCVHRESVGFI